MERWVDREYARKLSCPGVPARIVAFGAETNPIESGKYDQTRAASCRRVEKATQKDGGPPDEETRRWLRDDLRQRGDRDPCPRACAGPLVPPGPDGGVVREVGMERAMETIVRIYELVDELEKFFPGRHFTPDGHMVGSIGEAWAKWMYDLTLLQASAKGHDATARDGRRVQIKATQGASVLLSEEPDHLVILKLRRDGIAEEIYNGPGAEPWRTAGKPSKAGYRRISVAALRQLMMAVDEDARLPTLRRY